jgi:flagellar biogenesis protein FliO
MLELTIIVKIILSLVIVILTMYGLLFLLKKYIPVGSGFSNENDIKIRDLKFVGKDKGLFTVEFDNKIILFSFSPNSIEKIQEKEIKQEKNE